MAADRFTRPHSPDREGPVSPDPVAPGCDRVATHARAIMAERLVFRQAYPTTRKEANRLEDRLDSIWQQSATSADGSPDPRARHGLDEVWRGRLTLKFPSEG